MTWKQEQTCSNNNRTNTDQILIRPINIDLIMTPNLHICVTGQMFMQWQNDSRVVGSCGERRSRESVFCASTAFQGLTQSILNSFYEICQKLRKKTTKKPPASHHDEVDEGDRVETDVPQPHDAKHVDHNHGDGDADEHSRPQLKAQQHRSHHKYGCQWHAQVQSSVVRNGEVLLVKHVEDAVREEQARLLFIVHSIWDNTDATWLTCRQKRCGPWTDWYSKLGFGPFSEHLWNQGIPSGWCGRSWSRWLRCPCCWDTDQPLRRRLHGHCGSKERRNKTKVCFTI